MGRAQGPDQPPIKESKLCAAVLVQARRANRARRIIEAREVVGIDNDCPMIRVTDAFSLDADLGTTCKCHYATLTRVIGINLTAATKFREKYRAPARGVG